MKKAEEMFMAINNVDERLIDEAKGRDEKPVLIQVEKHLPVKEIVGFAACFAVLVTGIFMLMKFRINTHDPINSVVDPVGSTISDNSSQESDTSSTESSVSNPEDPDISPENKELMAILKDLTANAVELDGIFTRLSDQGEKYRVIRSDDVIDDYYAIGDNRKTEPLGLFTVPQTRNELKQLLLTCFTERSAQYYMDDVGTGHTKTNEYGENVIIADPTDESIRLIEADGKLYRRSFYYEVRPDIDYTTATVTSKTDKTIKFAYSHTDGTASDTEGVLVYENGAWKFDHFLNIGFIPELPTEFTDEEKELHEILNDLSAEHTLYAWFYRGSFYAKEFNFRIKDSKITYANRPVDLLNYVILEKSYRGLEYPHTCEEVEELLLKYYTQETAGEFMKAVGKGTMVENPDGTYTVTAENKDRPIFIEIDGNMYLWRRDGGGPFPPMRNTAKIIERTADTIKFSAICHVFNESYAEEGMIKYERGGWRMVREFEAAGIYE